MLTSRCLFLYNLISSSHSFITVSPGFDDSRLIDPNRQNGTQTITRENGATYARCWEFALTQKQPSFLIISSFNEFHENSHIEPTVEQARDYLDATERFASEAREKWGDL